MAKDAREVSRGSYTFNVVDAEALQTGSAQRQADALERIANTLERIANRSDNVFGRLMQLKQADRAVHKRLRALEKMRG